MILEIENSKRTILKNLFKNNKTYYIIDSILEGYIGKAEADSAITPTIAKLTVGELIAFGGDLKHKSVYELIKKINAPSMLMPSSKEWEDLYLKIHKKHIVDKIKRYTFYSNTLNISHLENLKNNLPKEYKIEKINIDIAKAIFDDPKLIGEDHIRNFNTPENFIKNGYGYVIIKDDNIVSCASTFAICNKGIEIQVNTKEEFKKRGLATIVCTKLIIETINRGLDPHWDASNEISVKLAKKLGYKEAETYEMIVYDI